MCSSSGAASAKAASQARADDNKRAQAINQGTAAINSQFDPGHGFNNDFYAGREKAYSDYYAPQVQRQAKQADQDLSFQLARQGITDSSAGAKQHGLLNTQAGIQMQNVASGAHDFGNATHSQVEGARSNLIDQLHATSDPTAAANMAINKAKLLQSGQNGFSPLGNLFTNVAGLVSNYQTNQAYSPQQQQGLLAQKGPIGGTSGTNAGSSKVVAG